MTLNGSRGARLLLKLLLDKFLGEFLWEIWMGGRIVLSLFFDCFMGMPYSI